MNKIIEPLELLKLLDEQEISIDIKNKYFAWQKLNLNDFTNFRCIGILKSEKKFDHEYGTTVNYWDPNYPIALEYYPNNNCKIHFDGNYYFFVYKEFAGHVPETRCRLIRKELIIPSLGVD